MRFYFKYLYSYLLFVFSRTKLKSDEYNLVLVIPKDSAGWILEAICKEIVKYYSGNFFIAYSIHNLPTATNYFFSHHIFFTDALKSNPILWGRNTIVFHTHEKLAQRKNELLFALNKASKVVCMNSSSVRSFIDMGFKSSKVDFVIAGADKDIFGFHERGNGCVGFSTAYYERKNPDTILEIIKKMPNKNFLLLGKNWNLYPRYEELKSLQNLEILELSYDKYPAQYARMDVFVSVSKLEGGPIPLIESMMSNVVPVVSNTGFAPDVIKSGENGFLFDPEESIDGIVSLIEKACLSETNIRDTIIHYTWENFSKNIQLFFK